MKTLIVKIISLTISPLLSLFPKGKIVVLQTHNPHIYCENTMYLYEYLSVNSKIFDTYWVTESEEIKKYLNSKNYKYISKKRLLNFLWISLRAKIVIDSGDSFFNPLGLIGRKVVKISTYHGNGPKTTATTFDSLKENLAEVFKINRFDFVNVASDYSIIRTHRNVFRLPKSKIISLGFPRCDQFFEEDFVAKSYAERQVASYLLGKKVVSDEKIILYTPTWRPYDYPFPLSSMIDFDYNRFDKFLESKNSYFFYSVHTANLPKSLPNDLKRIIYINPEKFPFYDVNKFMMEVDILLNDYSTTTTDFCLLKKAQVHFLPDLERYEKEKGFVDNYLDVIPGPTVQNYNELTTILENYLMDREKYYSEYSEKIKTYTNRYYNCENKNSRENFKKFIENLVRT